MDEFAFARWLCEAMTIVLNRPNGEAIWEVEDVHEPSDYWGNHLTPTQYAEHLTAIWRKQLHRVQLIDGRMVYTKSN